mmetsp:Transcript_85831/g.179336  ORF Transcript_85831/g.179336 Transcript_85831/m.179336 type:complete len:200 (-) Transcript_85831:1186-1785(-)
MVQKYQLETFRRTLSTSPEDVAGVRVAMQKTFDEGHCSIGLCEATHHSMRPNSGVVQILSRRRKRLPFLEVHDEQSFRGELGMDFGHHDSILEAIALHDFPAPLTVLRFQPEVQLLRHDFANLFCEPVEPKGGLDRSHDFEKEIDALNFALNSSLQGSVLNLDSHHLPGGQCCFVNLREASRSEWLALETFEDFLWTFS